MLDQNQIDWNAVDNDVQVAAASSNASEASKEVSKFIKFKTGFHYLRIVPAGNNLQKKPYLHLVQHPMKVPKDDGSGTRDAFVLCWSSVLNDLVKLGDPQSGGSKEKQQNNSMVSYLGQVNKINQEEFKKYQTFGCPMCKAFNYLNQMGVAKEVKNPFYPQEQYFFNAIHRSKQPDGMPSFGDDNVYIWRLAKLNGGKIVTIINTMRKQASINYLDIATGRDILMQATGEGQGRRYPVLQFMDFPTPLNLGERLPHNLCDLIANSHHDYQKVVNMMKINFGKLLQQNGYVIPGDQAMQQQYGHANEAVYQAQQAIAQAQNPSQFAGQNVQVPNPPMNVTVPGGFPPPSNPVISTPQQAQAMYNDGDGVEYRNGVLYNKSTGQPMF